MPASNRVKIYGTFLEDLPTEEHLTLQFAPARSPRNRRWKNYGLSADFLGDYFAEFFPGDALPESKINRQETARAAISYIANELLENGVKYSDGLANLPIVITLQLYAEKIVIEVTNHATPQAVAAYQQFIERLLNANLEQLYTEQLEKTALGSGDSSLGILTMVKDYGAELGWRFQVQTVNPDVTRVQVMAHLQI
ncbi:MAG: ATP-binding protein [Leptolyngbya sp. RL_3_1]|nr:ATP-binding protein [Leptolyngbya sp. RL_3_1]